jgi:hypothetical protein
MPLVENDLTEYLGIRQKMRLLPNLIDFGLAYALFRPVLRIDSVLRPLAQLKGTTLESNVIPMLISEPLLFLMTAMLYLRYALLYAIAAVAIYSRLKSLVHSDNRLAITIIGVIALILTLWLSFVLLPYVGIFTGMGLVYPGVYVYAAFIYLRRLKAIEKHPDYYCLLGIKRRSFTFATARYGLRSDEEESAALSGVLVLGGMGKTEGIVIRADYDENAIAYAESLRFGMMGVKCTDVKQKP